MKRLFLILLWGVFLTHSVFLYSQEKYDYLQEAGLNAAIFRGPEVVKYQFRYQGTPYAYTEDFSMGSLVYNDVKYDGVELNLNAHKDELHLKITSSGVVLELDKNIVGEFVIGRRQFVTLVGEKAIDGLPQGYYQVLYKGGDILLKKNIRTFHERLQTSGSGVFRYFDQSNKYYLLKDGIVYPVGKNKDFAKVYKENKKEIKGFIRHNRMKFLDMDDKDLAFVAIMEFANKK